MQPKEVVRILMKNGFVKVSQKGSHAKFINSETRRMTIVPIHLGDLPIGTLKEIQKQSGVDFK